MAANAKCLASPTVRLAHVARRRRLQRQTAESRWREMIDARRAPPGVLADAWYELAALHDAAGRYAEAFDALTQAKRHPVARGIAPAR